MVPPKKKRKVVDPPTKADETMEDAMTDDLLPTTVDIPSMEALDATLDDFLQCIDALDTTSTNDTALLQSSSLLLSVKGMQRTLLSALEQTETAVATVQTQVERHAATMANLQYEQGHWQAKIQHLQATAKTPQLQAMCREELNVPAAGSTDQMALDNDDDDDDGPTATAPTSTRALLQQFLHGQDIYNAEHSSQQVVASLHREIHERGTLERDGRQRAKELTNLQGIWKKRTQFLHQLPDKLKDMEKASLPLQRFFAATAARNSSSATTGDHSTVQLNSTDRSTRLQLAQSLCGPLYTLLVQVQSYLDDFPHQKGMSLEIVNTATANNHKTTTSSHAPPHLVSHEKAVVWHVPIPNIAQEQAFSSTSLSTMNVKKMSITFTYFPVLQVVTAKVTSGAESSLLVEPATALLQWTALDTGDYQVRMPVASVKQQQQQQEEEGDNNNDHPTAEIPVTIYGKPYLWCNYLAGLHLASGRHPNEGLCGSTRAIAQDLTRHVRANAILAYLLHKVVTSKVTAAALPPHLRPNNPTSKPPSAGSPQSTAKLVSFKAVIADDTATTTKERMEKVYAVQLKRGSGPQAQQIKVHVKLNVSQYPVVPPVWSLTGNQLQWGVVQGSYNSLHHEESAAANDQPPLHDARLAALEQRVNDVPGLVQRLQERHEAERNNEEDKTTEMPDESWYCDWILSHQLREIMMEWEESGGDGEDSGIGNAGGRRVRGRDRAPTKIDQ